VAYDPKKSYKAPGLLEPVPYLNFSRLENALAALKTAAAQYASLSGNIARLSPEKTGSLNAILYQAERSLLREQGLPRRPWYRHQVYAPGFYTGYGVKTMPGIREGIEEKNWTEAQQFIDEAAIVIERYTQQVRKASDLLK
jgi:N-acetylated-alpha-linked acidic dipeptidase